MAVVAEKMGLEQPYVADNPPADSDNKHFAFLESSLFHKVDEDHALYAVIDGQWC